MDLLFHRNKINLNHENVNKMDKSLEILEVSTKSTNPIGVALSAFNLKFYEINTDKEYPLENIFQSSKSLKEEDHTEIYLMFILKMPKETKGLNPQVI